jgi:hypothetical protein
MENRDKTKLQILKNLKTMENLNVVTPPGTPLHVNIVTPPGTPLAGGIEPNGPVGHMNGINVIPFDGPTTPVVPNHNGYINDGYHTPTHEPVSGISAQGVSHQRPPSIREEREAARRQREASRPPLAPISARLAAANQALQDEMSGVGANRLPKVKTNFPDAGEEPTVLGKRGRDSDDDAPPPPMAVSA